MDDGERYLAIKDKSGAAYLCPLAAARNAAEADRAIGADVCVEAEVAGRYAGQIKVKRD
jgi:hypothetical protein